PAYLLQGLVDIDWDFAAVTAPVLLVAGALAARSAPERLRFSPFAAAAGAGAALVVLLSLFAVWLGDRWSGEAVAALDRPAHAVSLAKRARSVNPFSVEPLYAQALAEQELGQASAARGLLIRATHVQPQNAESWFSLGEFDLQLGCPRHALPELERFYELNAQDPAVTEKDKALK